MAKPPTSGPSDSSLSSLAPAESAVGRLGPRGTRVADSLEQQRPNNHGPLGTLYPPKTWTGPNPHGALKEGDTPSWFYFYENGLNVPEQPGYGGWGGRFAPNAGFFQDAQDTVSRETSGRATVWRWRPAFQNEFQARMDWCVWGDGKANHKPLAMVNGDAS